LELFVDDLIDQVQWNRINVSEDICCSGKIGEEIRKEAGYATQAGHASHDGLELFLRSAMEALSSQSDLFPPSLRWFANTIRISADPVLVFLVLANA
jgi:hypothetical protein